jgi:hypothetical protein
LVHQVHLNLGDKTAIFLWVGEVTTNLHLRSTDSTGIDALDGVATTVL